jgi:hypothetical protein
MKAKKTKVALAVVATLSVDQKARIASLVKIGADVTATLATRRAECEAIFALEFPNKKSVEDYKGHWKPFSGDLRESTNNGWAYTCLLAWCKEKFGGLPTAKNGILTKAKQKAQKKKGMSGGRIINAIMMKANAFITYADNLDVDLVTPDMLEAISKQAESLAEFVEVCEEYKEADKAAATAR